MEAGEGCDRARRAADASGNRGPRPADERSDSVDTQGEPSSALTRMSIGEHKQITIGKGDVVKLLSNSAPVLRQMWVHTDSDWVSVTGYAPPLP